ncbi:unnamed protein product [Closterium sp. Yama58-4]|nr:unnamed protein product [Closterium sp. Yama58-4]
MAGQGARTGGTRGALSPQQLREWYAQRAASGVALLELELLRLETLELEALALEALGLAALELELLVLEVLVLEVLELPELVVLLVLEVLVVLALLVPEVLVLEVLELLELVVLRALELEALGLEELELEVLEMEALELEALALKVLELLVLVLEVLVLVVLVLVVLHSRDCSSLRRHRRLCHRLTRCFARFLAFRLLLASRYSQAPHCLLLLLTLSRQTRLQSVRPPPVPGTHTMTLRPSSVPQRVPLPSPPESSLPHVPDPESDLVRAADATVTRLLATVVTDPSFESAAASALVTELVDFAAACRLDYATSLVAESESVCPPSVGGECALGMDVLEDRQEDFAYLAAAVPHLVAMLLAPEGDPDALDIPTPRSYAEAITGPYSSQWQAAMDAKMASWKSTCTYVDAVPPPGANIVDVMWIFRVKRSPGSPPVFKARYVV